MTSKKKGEKQRKVHQHTSYDILGHREAGKTNKLGVVIVLTGQ